MSLFRKFFRSKSEKEKEEIQSTGRGKYMPKIDLPIDESFTMNFKENGGKFLYCENLNEIFDNLELILTENEWGDKPVYIYDENLKERFKNFELKTGALRDATYFITTCENLISVNGSILISSNQIAEKKLPEFPDNFIVFATTSQIVSSISEGLCDIKSKNVERIPSNITTIKHFKQVEEKDFLSYGSSSKNLYLLLLEDL